MLVMYIAKKSVTRFSAWSDVTRLNLLAHQNLKKGQSNQIYPPDFQYSGVTSHMGPPVPPDQKILAQFTRISLLLFHNENLVKRFEHNDITFKDILYIIIFQMSNNYLRF